jgi:hypothetical protein
MTKYLLSSLLLLTACPGEMDPPQSSDSGVAHADAEPVLDAGEDGGIAYSPVTVRSRYPSEQLAVIFHDPTGAVISSTITTAEEVSETVPPGSMVTLVQTGDTSVLHTVIGVLPGETYEHIDGDAVIGRIELTVPTPFPDGVDYDYDIGCGPLIGVEPMVPQLIEVTRRCTGGADRITVVVLAYDSDRAQLAYAFEEDVLLDPNNVTTLSLGTWHTELDPLEITYVGSSAERGTLIAYWSVISGATAVHRDGIVFPRPIPAQARRTARVPRFGDRFRIGMTLEATFESPIYSSVFGYQADRALRSFDLAVDLLPPPSLAAIDSTDPARPVLQWSSAADLDGIVVRVNADEPRIRWSFLVAPGTSELRIPALPDEHAALRPLAASVLRSAVADFEISTVDDYDAYRTTFGAQLFNPMERHVGLPANGTVWRLSLNPAY